MQETHHLTGGGHCFGRPSGQTRVNPNQMTRLDYLQAEIAGHQASPYKLANGSGTVDQNLTVPQASMTRQASQNRSICSRVPRLTRRQPSIRGLPAMERTRMPASSRSRASTSAGSALGQINR